VAAGAPKKKAAPKKKTAEKVEEPVVAETAENE
jgi:hypothetical protein